MGHCKEINTHLQVFCVVIVYPLYSEPPPHDITCIVGKFGVWKRVAYFYITPSCSQTF